MVRIKSVDAKAIDDSRGDKTISITIETEKGKEFSASAPQGKSRGKNEVKPYKKSLENDIDTIKKIKDYFSEEVLEKFEDLKRIEHIAEDNLGGNSVLALEYAALKAMAYEQKKEPWKIINPELKKKDAKFPRLVGNCVGGGQHSKEIEGKKPDFQEFHLIPNSKSVKKSQEENKKAREKVEYYLKEKDKNFNEEKNDENAWQVSINQREVLKILNKTGLSLGVDIAASEFYKRKKYNYKNPMIKRTPEEQLYYIDNLVKKEDVYYIEDPFQEEDFENHSNLLEKNPERLIVGDDLTVTNPERLKKAIENKSINGIIVKPNQCGSLLSVKEVCDIAKEAGIKTVFSHRSGETKETMLADIAFAFQADFFKCGIEGDIREGKIDRLIEIEEKVSK